MKSSADGWSTAAQIAAAVGHLPALWLVTKCRPTGSLIRLNGMVLVASLAAASVPLFVLPPPLSLAVCGVVFAAGHVAWSVILLKHMRVGAGFHVRPQAPR